MPQWPSWRITRYRDPHPTLFIWPFALNAEFILILAALLTSLTAAIGGIAGGVVLITVMPGLLPVSAIVPIHGLVQIVSNVSRTALGIRHIEWRIVRAYALGTIVGAAIGSQVVPYFSWEHLPLALGAFILVLTWMPRFEAAPRIPGVFTILGTVQSALSLFVGVTGPLNMPFLLREDLGRDRTVITHAVQMTAMHGAKVVTFGILGFAFFDYWRLVLGMAAGAAAGSWAGTQLREYVPEHIFRIGIKILLTALCLRIILQAVGFDLVP